MPSFIVQNLSRLRRRHYLRNATAENHWFDFTASRLESYISRFGEDFCLVINGALEYDDAYVLPYRIAKRWFRPEDVDARGRWVGTIIAGRMKLTCTETSLPVEHYRNAFGELGGNSSHSTRNCASTAMRQPLPGDYRAV